MKEGLDLGALAREWDENHAKFIDLLGIRLEGLEPGSAVMRLPFRDELTNGAGAVHGGAIASLCDTALYLAHISLYGRGEPTATTNMTCDYLAAVRGPHDLVARAKILKAGRRMVFGEVSVYSDERLVAHATLTYMNTSR